MNCPYTLRSNFVPHLSGNRHIPILDEQALEKSCFSNIKLDVI
ncbi:MAG: hypothetical protein V7K50_22830 [Nostoc sp.]